MTTIFKKSLCFLWIFLIMSIRIGYSSGMEMTAINDFMNPELLQIPILESKGPEPQTTFSYVSSRLLTGVTSSLQYRNEHYDTDSLFYKISNNYHFKNHQIGFDFTGYKPLSNVDDAEFDNAPRLKARAQYARYLTLSSEKTNNSISERDTKSTDSTDKKLIGANRIQFSFDVENRRNDENVYEFIFELETKWSLVEKLDTLFPSINSLTYAWKPEEKEHFFSFGYRYYLNIPLEETSLKWEYWLSGSFHRDDWRWGGWMNSFMLEFYDVVYESSTVNLGYILNRDFDNGEWRHQFGIFVNIPIYSKII